MTEYSVWVSQAGGTDRVPLLVTDDSEQAANLASALVGYSGSTSFDIGVSVQHTDDGGEAGAAKKAAGGIQRQTPHQQRQTNRPQTGQ